MCRVKRLLEHYAAAHVFVLPSYNEGMSVALLEAMASGLAVVVTPTGGTPELVEPEVNGFIFDWADVDGLTTHLRRFAQDRSLVTPHGRSIAPSRAAISPGTTAALRYIDIFTAIDAVAPSPSERHFTLRRSTRS